MFKQVRINDAILKFYQRSQPIAFSNAETLYDDLVLLRDQIIMYGDLSEAQTNYLNNFIDKFDTSLNTTVRAVFEKWLDDGFLVDFIRDLINEEVVEARDGESELNLRLIRDKQDIEAEINLLKDKDDQLSTQLEQIALNANNFDTYQEAVNTAQNTTGVLMFPAGEHYLNNILMDPTKSLTVLGRGIKNTIIKAESTAFIIEQDDSEALGNTIVITDIPYGSKVLNVATTTGIKKGQLVHIKSSQNMEETSTPSKKQYTSFVDEVYTDKIVLTDNAPQSFDSGFVIKVLTFDHSPIVFNDLSVESKRSIGATAQTACFYLKNVADFTLNNVLMKDRDESKERNPSFDGSHPLLNGVSALQSKKIRVNNTQMLYLIYGVLCHDGTSDVIITNPYAYYSRHVNNFGLGAYDLKIQGGKAYACYASYDAHDTTIDVELYDCFSTGGVIPTKLRARKKVIRNSTFEDGLWATINDSVLNAIPYETNEGSTFGVWLYNTDIKDPDNRRTFLDGYTTVIDGGNWENVTTTTTGSVNRKILVVENLIYHGEDNINNADLTVFINAENNTIRNCHAIGHTHGVPSIDNESSNKLFFYHATGVDSKVTFENNLIDGFRSGYFMGAVGDYYDVTINNNRIINSGEAIRCVPSSMTFVGSIENNTFEGNFKDFDKTRIFKSDIPINALPHGLALNSRNAPPGIKTGVAKIFIHSLDNQLKIQFDDGTIKTIVVE